MSAALTFPLKPSLNSLGEVKFVIFMVDVSFALYILSHKLRSKVLEVAKLVNFKSVLNLVRAF